MIVPIAIIILNIIALIALLFACSELNKAIREMDKLSSSLDSSRAAARRKARLSYSDSHVSTTSRDIRGSLNDLENCEGYYEK